MASSDESRITKPESRLEDLIRERGPLTVAAFMELALYDRELGYYARAARRSGRAGDFFTSVDVGPLFGELLEIQLAEMSSILHSQFQIPDFDLVEAGAGNGRLSADILRAARERDPAFYDSIRVHLVDASAAARSAHAATLGDTAARLASSGPLLPSSFDGTLIANELLDAMPVHQVVMREKGLKEIYVVARSRSAEASRSKGVEGARDDNRGARGFSRAELTLVEGPPSTPALDEYFARLDIVLQSGWRAEINLRAVSWMRNAARRLRRGFIILVDYGHEARELYSPTHAGGTLTTFTAHRSGGPEASAETPPWLQAPGEQDITAHVDFTSVRAAAEAEGLQTLGFLDQTYFLLGLLNDGGPLGFAASGSVKESRYGDVRQRLALKTLIMPGGLGSSHKVLIFGKGVGTPALLGCSYRMRVT